MQLNSLSLPLLAAVFITGGIAIWIAGIKLSDCTDVLSRRFKLNQALAGAVILAIVTNLPEIAITVSAALKNNLGLAVGNILGGIALQTVVLVILDVSGLGKQGSLTAKGSSMPLIMEAIFVVIVLTLVIIGNQLPASLIFYHIAPADILITASWLLGLWLISKAQTQIPWKFTETVPGGDQNSSERNAKKKEDNQSTAKLVTALLVSALVTLIAGVALEQSSDAMAKHLHMDGLIFGATVLAVATSLPEIATGLSAVKLGDTHLAISDIFGGNGFLPVLFLVATLISGKAVLPLAHKSDIYLTCLGILLTIIYIVGMIFRSKKQVFYMGVDSFIVLLVYLAGAGGLFFLGN